METQDIIKKLTNWAKENENIRALVLTSSKAEGSDSPTDQFSDYDVAVYVSELSPFQTDEWLSHFGEVLVKWPQQPQSTFNKIWLTRLVVFESRLRIDFQITDTLNISPSDADLGYQVLVDKDGITTKFPQDTKSEFLIEKPTEEDFLELVNDFFWDSTYVPKYLWRGELFFAKFMFDSALRFEYFEKMIEWKIGSENDWAITTNKHGRYFEQYLSRDEWQEIKQTFADAEIEHNWLAFFKMVELFTKYAKNLANKLRFTYPEEQEKKMLTYYKQSKELSK